MNLSMPLPNNELSDALATTLLANLGAFQSFARSRLYNEELAADAVQESLYRALKSAPTLSDEHNLIGWFYRILRNVLVDLHRRDVTRSAALARFAFEDESAEMEAEKAVVCACLLGLLPTLHPDYAKVIQLADLDEKSPADVADQLGISRDNLKVRLHRARQQLRSRLEQTCQMCATHGCLDCTCHP